jgi:exosortase C (VPDSG-CTERM-specific)
VPNPSRIESIQGPLQPVSLRQPSVAAQVKSLALLSAVLLGCFAWPLAGLLRFAIKSDLFSHILLIPFISAYLIWVAKDALPPAAPPRRYRSIFFFAAGAAVLAAYWFGPLLGLAVKRDHLTWTTSAFLLFFIGLCFLCLSPATLRKISFPLALLVFAIPFPFALVDWIETMLQHTSALAADWFFTLTGTTFLRDGLLFQLPNIRIQVAPECSGIHSTLVLLITSLVAGQLFLTSQWKRALLAVAVIPLGILRNGFRIWSLGQLCIHMGPQMIDSPIHHRGGPIFFALSMIPFTFFLFYLWKSDRRPANHAIGPSEDGGRRAGGVAGAPHRDPE